MAGVLHRDDDGAAEDLGIGRSVHAALAEVDRVVALVTEPRYDTQIHAHVGKEAHRRIYDVRISSRVSQAAYSRAC